MRAALVVTADPPLCARLLRELGNRSVFTESGQDEALRMLRTTEVDLVLIDVTAPVRNLTSFIARSRQLSPSAVVVCLYQTEGLAPEDREALEAADLVLRKPFTREELALVIRQGEEKQELLLQVASLRARRPAAAQEPATETNGTPEVTHPDLAPVVKEVAKALSAGFDLPRILNLFLDAVAEMVKPSRAALLLADETGTSFTIRAQRGLAPQVVAAARLSAEGGLPLWLQTQGRLIHAEEARARAQEWQTRDLARELAMLQAVLAIPLIAHGELVAILTLGQRITGIPYSHRETEVLFNLATHLATAIRDIRLHHQLNYQKVYIERILSHMAHGVITIDRQESVTIMNRRAEEILGLSAEAVLHHDLRVLPSPLGDMLYESLTRGTTVRRREIQLALRNLPLEVSTYPIAGDDPTPLGAVMVFEDLTGAKQLAAEKRQAEQFQLLSQIVARISDEIKNPLVSINTFMELLEEQFEDAEFRHQFTLVVGRDVRRMVELFEKLSALVSEGPFNFEVVDAQDVVEECLASLGAAAEDKGEDARILQLTDEASGKRVIVSLYPDTGALRVKGDRAQLKKAVSFLVWYLARKSPGEEAKLSLSIGRPNSDDEIVQILVASRTAEVSSEEIERIFDPLKMVQESLIDVGPCVSQRIIEALGGQLQARKGRHEVSFLASLPAAAS
ncbi:MAG: GAF domain-containing protein [Candidatus Rokubacteria bacterium]|nr:GAF domain-containing protein [Candidatus Rokubacteria bacterium]